MTLLGIAGMWWFWPKPPTGQVSASDGPVVGAVVRYQGNRDSVLTDCQGRFQMPFPSGKSKRLTAWKAGYAIASIPRDGSWDDMHLLPLPAADNDNYPWIDPTPNPQQPNNCGNCHAEIHREWSLSAHAQSSTRPQVLAAFAELVHDRPNDIGVCARCHAPTMRDPTLDYDLRKISGIDTHGVHCDYCHKVIDAPAGKFGTRFGNDGLQLLRPPNGQLLSFGPLDDAVREGEQFGYSPIYKDSRYCASCHEGIIYGAHVYGTYSEWLESPARKQGKQCQTCHMAPTGKMTNIAPGQGGIERDPRNLGSHAMPGATADMLRRCLSVKVSFTGNEVEVEVKADHVGHRVPTGSPDHNLELSVMTMNKVPAHVFSSQARYFLASKVYAKQSKDPQTNRPAPFWLWRGEPEDTRLFPGKADHLRYPLPVDAKAVYVTLTYRRYLSSYVAAADGRITVFGQVIPRR